MVGKVCNVNMIINWNLMEVGLIKHVESKKADEKE